jgi:hypothetical protein
MKRNNPYFTPLGRFCIGAAFVVFLVVIILI